MITPEILKERIVGACQTCGGRGFYEGEDFGQRECSCLKRFKTLVAMVVAKFPDEHIDKIQRGVIDQCFTINDGDNFFNRAKDNPNDFVKPGLGLVFYGSIKSSIASSSLIHKMLEKNFTLKVRYFDGDRALDSFDFESDLIVIDNIEYLNRPMIERTLIQRDKKMQSTFVNVPYKEIINDWINLGDYLSWDGKNFYGDVYRGIGVTYIPNDSRWDR